MSGNSCRMRTSAYEASTRLKSSISGFYNSGISKLGGREKKELLGFLTYDQGRP